MRKLALDDDILLNIEKPARYIGHEVNSVMKNKNAVDIRFAMCFPEVYGREQMFVSYSITQCYTVPNLGEKGNIWYDMVLCGTVVKRDFVVILL